MLSWFKVADIVNDTFVPCVKPSTSVMIISNDVDKENDDEDEERKKVKNVYLRMQWKKW